MRIGIRLTITGLVLASIMVSAVGVHLLWWRTAEANSHELAETINQQIVAAVGKELANITAEARAAHTAIRTLFVQNVRKSIRLTTPPSVASISTRSWSETLSSRNGALKKLIMS